MASVQVPRACSLFPATHRESAGASEEVRAPIPVKTEQLVQHAPRPAARSGCVAEHERGATDPFARCMF